MHRHHGSETTYRKSQKDQGQDLNLLSCKKTKCIYNAVQLDEDEEMEEETVLARNSKRKSRSKGKHSQQFTTMDTESVSPMQPQKGTAINTSLQ